VSTAGAFAGLIAGVLVWWLAVSRLSVKPWETAGAPSQQDHDPLSRRAQSLRTGLLVFLAVVTSFFGLLVAAYAIRMSPQLVQGAVFQDWQPLEEPPILWLNTLLLMFASAAMQAARTSADRGLEGRARTGMLAGGVFALAFLAGQLTAWQELRAAGLYSATNPAYAFFFVLTGLHGLHVLGGLVVWSRALARMWRGGLSDGAVRVTVELCTVYWHYLLVVWLALFGLLLVT
jgi:cytochrome c oxidase subunit 3